MYIETTYMMTDEVMDLLAKAEEETGYDQMELVALCMQMMRENHKEYLEKRGRIKYQDRLDEETGLPITVADDPLSCVVLGSGRALESLDVFRGVTIA